MNRATVSTLFLVAAGTLTGGAVRAAPSAEAVQAARRLQVPAGWTAHLWAAEPDVQNPVALSIDAQGRVYVAETHRRKIATLDIRQRAQWLPAQVSAEERRRFSSAVLAADLAAQRLEDREALLRRFLPDRLDEIAAPSERVRVLWDRDGDGRADRAVTFADGFSSLLDGVAAGVLARGKDVWLTSIPNLWRLRDDNGDGVADRRTVLSTGYGVRFGFGGHDLHAPRLGPDGRLYFSIGDRGAYVQTNEGRLDVSDTGAVFRCEPDGSRLELFALGLRNPHDLVFDEHGNLFTADNNADGGDKARFVHLVQGSDAGWRIGYQFMAEPQALGPWQSERLWFDRGTADLPAYIVPPVGHVAHGPAGLTYDGGGALGGRWKGHFFLADFQGQAGTSGIWAFTVEPRGGGFGLGAATQIVKGALVTDVELGPDGALYASDWVVGWEMTGKGRIYRLTPPGPDRTLAALLATDLTKSPTSALLSRLAHGDPRVRTDAQFALVDRGATGELLGVLQRGASTLPRLHALWGLGQLARRRALPEVTALLSRAVADDRDPEIRAHAAQILGDQREASAQLTAALGDPSLRVRMHAAIALGKLGRPEVTPALLRLLRENADADPVVRHAAVMGLVGARDVTALVQAGRDASRAVRMGALLALRRLERPEVTAFLSDRDAAIVREAARAIHDVPIWQGEATLAAHRSRDPVVLARVIAANHRQGDLISARRLARLAADRTLPIAIRTSAVQTLALWSRPAGPSVDLVTGAARPLPAGRDLSAGRESLAPIAARLLADDRALAVAAARAAGTLGISSVAPVLTAAVHRGRDADLRLSSLRALSSFQAPGWQAALNAALQDRSPAVRAEALRLAVHAPSASVMDRLAQVLDRGELRERQAAVAALAEIDGPEPDRILQRWLDRLVARQTPPGLMVDLLEAARRRATPELLARVATYEQARPSSEVGRFTEALEGGDAQAGREVFFTRQDLACARCHRVAGRGGGDVGPDLAGVGARRDRTYLLEAIVAPSKHFAPGFEAVLLTLKDGNVVGGTVKKESAEAIELVTPEQQVQLVRRATVQSREVGVSGMPEGLGDILSRRELRDVIEFLASQR